MAAAEVGSCSSSLSCFSFLEEDEEEHGTGGATGLLVGGVLFRSGAADVDGEVSRPADRQVGIKGNDCTKCLADRKTKTHPLEKTTEELCINTVNLIPVILKMSTSTSVSVLTITEYLLFNKNNAPNVTILQFCCWVKKTKVLYQEHH